MTDTASSSGTWSAALKGSMVNKWYWFRSTVGDMMVANELFPKEAGGNDVKLAGGIVVKEGDEARLLAELDKYVWFSYRNGFSGLPMELTYDTSWGCVHRTGQMMMMTVLRRHCRAAGGDLVHLFKDLEVSPYSIQRIALTGGAYGYEPGQWFAPTVIGKVIRDLVAIHMKGNPRPIRVVLGEDRTISATNLISAAEKGGALLLIPSMFGIDLPIKKPYASFLLSHLASKYSVGVLGGRPKHALYFIGHKGDHVVVLDPHRVQPAYVDSDSLGSTAQPRRISVPVAELDTCCLMGYFVQGQDEAEELLEFLKMKPPGMGYAYFCVEDKKPAVRGDVNTVSKSRLRAQGVVAQGPGSEAGSSNLR